MDTSGMIAVESLPERLPEEAAELRLLAQEGIAFLEGHTWYAGIEECYFARGFAKVALFLVRILPSKAETDDWWWVIVGDIPPAYLDTLYCRDATEALESYLFLCREWVDAVRDRQSTEDLMPIYHRGSFDRMDETEENANLLGARLDFIERKVLRSDL